MQQKVHQKQDKDENKKMGNLHILQSKNKKTNQPLQTYQHKQCIQKHKYNTAIRETKDAREKPGLQHERNIQTHL